MPYDYYEHFIKQRQNEKFRETSDRIRENIWGESINFRQMQNWKTMEERILIRLYWKLRYN